MANYILGTDNSGDAVVTVTAENGEIIEAFESSGCVYNDLGCCRGCWTCHIYDERYED